jgi:hypothetical protein
MSATVGRNYAIEYAIGLNSANPASLTFKRLGYLRGKELNSTWDTVDATGDTSPSNTKESLPTFVGHELSFDGVARSDAAQNQQELKTLIYGGNGSVSNQPMGWVRVIGQGRIQTMPVIFKEWSVSAPHAEVVTFSGSAMSNGAMTDVAA